MVGDINCLMKKLLSIVAFALLGIATASIVIKGIPAVGWDKFKRQFTLHSGWRVSPVGKSIDLPGDMPGSIIFSADGTRAYVNTCGYHDHSITTIDLKAQKAIATLALENNWVGMVRSGNQLLVSGGGQTKEAPNANILRFATQSSLTKINPSPLPLVEEGSKFIAHMAIQGERLYAVNIRSNEVILMHTDGSPRHKAKVGYRPFGIAISPNGQTIAVTEWGDRSVVLLDAATLAFKGRYHVGDHPSAIVWHKNGTILVTESNSNTVVAIRGSEMSRITVAVDPRFAVGAMPQAIAISPDSKTAYVALGGENAIAVLDMQSTRPQLIGHIPTQKFPTAVAATPDGKSLLIATGKGSYGPNGGAATRPAGATHPPTERNIYIGKQLAGNIRILPVPTSRDLVKLTRQAAENRPKGIGNVTLSPALKARAEQNLKQIKHCIFVIRENRTYDQVLGDLPQGNGDPTLTLYGERVTPNGHAIAKQFLLFDNLYTDGETSQAGHQWTTSAYASDYTEKAWVLNYSNRPEPRSDKRMTASPEYIWNLARKNGLWARVYGEYVDVQEDHNSLNSEEHKADPERYGYAEDWERIFARGGRDTEKIASFFKELDEFERTGKMPALMVMALPDDHTHGFDAGSFSPNAMIADNDRAVGQLVERMSRSKFWRNTAIFIIQDDAQGGPDHVDSHRTVGYVCSPYSRRAVVDSTHYTTASMLLTMEKALGLPPMTAFDGLATPMLAAFAGKYDPTPFKLLPPGVDINEINPSNTELARRSAKLDFSAYDKANFADLNRILWQGAKPGVPYPAHLATDY